MHQRLKLFLIVFGLIFLSGCSIVGPKIISPNITSKQNSAQQINTATENTTTSNQTTENCLSDIACFQKNAENCTASEITVNKKINRQTNDQGNIILNQSWKLSIIADSSDRLADTTSTAKNCKIQIKLLSFVPEISFSSGSNTQTSEQEFEKSIKQIKQEVENFIGKDKICTYPINIFSARINNYLNTETGLWESNIDLSNSCSGSLVEAAKPLIDKTLTKDRDTKRISALRQISKALELFYLDHNYYPLGTNAILGTGNYSCLNSSGFQAVGCTTPYIGTILGDPSPSGKFIYSAVINSSAKRAVSYTITAKLEGSINDLFGDIVASPSGITNKK